MAKQDSSSTRRIGRYHVQRRLGSGANSVIFEVSDPASGQSYALKQVLKRVADDERFFAQAENELVIGRQIDHPAIRKMYELHRVRSFFRVKEVLLLMEMFYGQTLESHRPTDMLAITRIFVRAVRGLDAMHAAGFVHADIKPNNILIGSGGEIKIIDLGQSCPIGTVKQRIQGTPDYIAPEQVHRRPIDQRTDVFNVGATMYWVLTGRHVPTVLPRATPGREIALVDTLDAHPPDTLNPRVPASLSKLVMDCVHVLPGERPADMKVLGAKLEMIELQLARARAEAGETHVAFDDEANGAELAEPDDDTVDIGQGRLDEAV